MTNPPGTPQVTGGDRQVDIKLPKLSVVTRLGVYTARLEFLLSSKPYTRGWVLLDNILRLDPRWCGLNENPSCVSPETNARVAGSICWHRDTASIRVRTDCVLPNTRSPHHLNSSPGWLHTLMPIALSHHKPCLHATIGLHKLLLSGITTRLFSHKHIEALREGLIHCAQRSCYSKPVLVVAHQQNNKILISASSLM